ncbi:hypothetical protein F4561_001509 [Lipingzhangella halophila]|uniref:Uncharacterized protein n=1 Tax=Lipingzhangella halophila TaxID=1783352 RepID=A0A7W7W2E7_9ACTN|nr:hypothetical protein [Lipingzhangella halophila]
MPHPAQLDAGQCEALDRDGTYSGTIQFHLERGDLGAALAHLLDDGVLFLVGDRSGRCRVQQGEVDPLGLDGDGTAAVGELAVDFHQFGRWARR